MIEANGKRYFTHSEACTYIPVLQGAFGRIQIYRQELSALHDEVTGQGLSAEVLLSSDPPLPPALERTRARVQELAGLIEAEIEQIHAIGCLVKDLDTGLVDFYSRQGGEDIFLCWRYGETEIRFWHSVNEGFTGRKPIPERNRDRSILN